jgi:arylsulfatase A-like enzyme
MIGEWGRPSGGRPGPGRVALLCMALGLFAAALATAAPAAAAAAKQVAPAPVTPKPNTAAAAGKPNIVLVTIDCLRQDRVFGAAQDKRALPSLERLAARAFRFDRAYAASPSIAPSHGSLLTGLDPAHHGLRHDLGARLDAGVTTLADRLRKAGYETLAVIGSDFLDSDRRLDRGFDRYDDDFPGVRKKIVFVTKERLGPDVVTAAKHLLDGRTAGKPLFLWVNFHDPAADYDPPDPFKADHGDDLYGGEVASLDAPLEGLFADLRERGLLDGAALVVAGADGEAMGEHQESGHGIYLYETTVRVPLVVAPPGGEGRSGVVRQPVSLTDVAPTLLEMAGIPATGLDGISFAPLLGGGKPSKSPRQGRPIFIEAVQPFAAYGWSPLFAMLDGDRKVVQGAFAEAFDLVADPGEERPLKPVPKWAKRLVEEGTARLGRTDVPQDKKTRIDAAVEAFHMSWEDSPLCASKDFWPDPRLPEKVALNADLFTAGVQQAQGQVGYSTKTGAKVLESDPDNYSAMDWIGFLGIRNHWMDALLEYLEPLQCRYPYRPSGYHWLAHYYEQTRKYDRALGVLEIMEMVDPESEDPPYDRAVILTELGRLEEAIASLQKSVDLGADEFDMMKKDPRLAPLRNDPRFQALVGADPTPAPPGSVK